jgi:hypothetical protein
MKHIYRLRVSFLNCRCGQRKKFPVVIEPDKHGCRTPSLGNDDPLLTGLGGFDVLLGLRLKIAYGDNLFHGYS